MSGARQRALLLVILAAIPVIAAAQLNPTVKVLPRPKSAVPAECEEGLAIQPAQRLTTEERTSVRDTSRDMQAPPSRSLRGELQTAFAAAQHNSRDAFRDALVQGKSMLTSYPPGGERTTASSLVDVLDDVDKIWDYQFSSPTGAFFDTSSEPYRIASKYSGYETFIRRQVITDQNGNKFYPTHETRDFLLTESGQRLSRLTGKPAPAPITSTRGTTTIARPAPRATTTPTITTAEKTPKPKPHHTMKQTTTHATRPTQHRATHKPVVREARAKTEPPHATPAPAPAPHVSKPAPQPTVSTPIVSTPTVSTPTRATSTPPFTTSSATTASSDTAITAPPSTTSASAPTETTGTTATTETNAASKPAQSRSLFGPILLIIVGIGLLLTLWRASS